MNDSDMPTQYSLIVRKVIYLWAHFRGRTVGEKANCELERGCSKRKIHFYFYFKNSVHRGKKERKKEQGEWHTVMGALMRTTTVYFAQLDLARSAEFCNCA